MHTSQASHPFVLKPLDWLITLIAGCLWGLMASMRRWIIGTVCISEALACQKETLPAIDQIAYGIVDPTADHFSFITQDTSGVLALLVPLIWFSFGRNITQAVTSIGIILQCVTINGVFTELSHWLSQRPRPFVYLNISNEGANPSHYTSFYSGHTSFSAASTSALFLILYFCRAPLQLLVPVAAAGEILVFLTAYFRVMAGRHFLTDTLCGALAGAFVSWIVVRSHLRAGPKQASL